MSISYQIPHMFWARIMLSQILKNNAENKYSHSTGPVFWGPYDNQPAYVCITDCSGFINALLIKSYNLKSGWMGRSRPLASTYYNQIVNNQNDFVNIPNIFDTKVGDFIVFKILPGTSKTNDTGHILLINNTPAQMQNKNPIIPNTLQWIVEVIDQTGTPHTKNDTRYRTNDEKVTGLGLGYMRIYTDLNGLLKGYSWSAENGSKYVDQNTHPLAIGRLELGPNY